MFWSKKGKAINISRLSSLLAHDTCVRGDVIFEGGLRIDGRVEGSVLGKADGRGLLVLSDKGTIVGTVKAHDAVINGRVEGDLAFKSAALAAWLHGTAGDLAAKELTPWAATSTDLVDFLPEAFKAL